MQIVPTMRIVCRKCGDDMICTEKTERDGYAFKCIKCDIKVNLLHGWKLRDVQ